MKFLEQLQAVIGVLVLVVVAILYARRAFGRTRGKRVTTTSNVFAVMDEVFSPARHIAALERRSQHGQEPVTMVPDGWLPPTHDGLYVHVALKPAPTDLPPSTRDTPAPSAAGFGTSEPVT